MLEFIFIYVSVCTSFGVILHEENESRTSMSDKEKLEFQLGFPYKYHEDDFLTSKEAHSRINKIYQ